MRTRAARLLAVPLVLLVAGCVDQDRPAACDADELSLEVTVGADGMEPNPLEACEGQTVSMTVIPEIDGVFHIHGYDRAVPATTIVAGEETVLDFAAELTGQFLVELHPAESGQGVDIGIFTVYER